MRSVEQEDRLIMLALTSRIWPFDDGKGCRADTPRKVEVVLDRFGVPADSAVDRISQDNRAQRSDEIEQRVVRCMGCDEEERVIVRGECYGQAATHRLLKADAKAVGHTGNQSDAACAL